MVQETKFLEKDSPEFRGYMFYTELTEPRPISYSPSWEWTQIGERVFVSLTVPRQ